MRALAACGGAILALAPAVASAQQGGGGKRLPQIKVEGAVAWLAFDGDIGASATAAAPTKIPLHSDLDTDNEIEGWDLRAFIGERRTGWLEFNHFRTSSRGEFFLHRPLLYRGVTFPVGTYTRTQVDLNYSTLLLGQVYGMGAGSLLGYEIGAAEIGWRARVRAPIDGKYASVSEHPSLPIFGVLLTVGFSDTITLEGVARGTFFAFTNADVKLVEGFCEAKWRLATWAVWHVGWRFFSLDAKFKFGGGADGFADIFLQGFFTGLEIQIG